MPDPRYFLDGERVHVGSLELHVVEHCNLRCRGCDVASPLWAERFLSTEDVAAVLARLRPLLVSEVLKIVGGEPLLHPDLVPILIAARDSGVGRRLRVTTNGLLLARASDDLYRQIDELFISHYSSAPVPAAQLVRAKERAERFGVSLRVKRVDRFAETIAATPHVDAAEAQRIYEACWLRHCSLIVRDGVFFKCTRAAYQDDLLARLGRARRKEDPESFRRTDGVPLAAPDFQARALTYLLSPTPLRSCDHCLGNSGPARPHAQLSVTDLRRLPILQ